MFLSFLIILTVVFVIYVRVAPSSADKWHVDPAINYQGAKSNSFQQTYRFEAPIELVRAGVLDAVSSDNGVLLSGDITGEYATFILRTPLIGYPDYVSVRINSLDASTTQMSVLSRSRFGRSDFGANKKRIIGWVQALRSAL